MPTRSGAALTDDFVLGGRLRLHQPRDGHRVGHDAILLAAACPARPGERAIDLGAGVGAAGLALAVRVADTDVTLVEIDPRLAALAADNVQRNGLAARVHVVTLDVAAPARAFAAAGLLPDSAMRVLMNPPFNNPATQRASPDSARRRAHVAPRSALAGWIRTAARLLRPGGTLSLIWRADGLGDVLGALAPMFGDIVVLPVHPQATAPAIRILVRAAKASRGPLALLSGLVLNDERGRPTAAAEAILRHGAPLPLGER
jgi:tRNA1(Val) A37 N6-methylase TrmN6